MLFTASSVRELIEQNDSVESDAQLKVDGKSIPIHRHYMSLISPVFAAIFKEGTKEAQSGEVDIPDFTYEVVKEAVDICYGTNLTEDSTSKINDLYRFFDKYNIAPLCEKLDAFFEKDVTTECFRAFLIHAWEKDDEELLKKCAKFLKQNTQLTFHPDFVSLEQPLMKHVLELVSKEGDDGDKSEVKPKVKPEVAKVTPRGITCKVCNVNPIVGIRYKCSVCADFDLCDSCFKQALHPNHNCFVIDDNNPGCPNVRKGGCGQTQNSTTYFTTTTPAQSSCPFARSRQSNCPRQNGGYTYYSS